MNNLKLVAGTPKVIDALKKASMLHSPETTYNNFEKDIDFDPHKDNSSLEDTYKVKLDNSDEIPAFLNTKIIWEQPSPDGPGWSYDYRYIGGRVDVVDGIKRVFPTFLYKEIAGYDPLYQQALYSMNGNLQWVQAPSGSGTDTYKVKVQTNDSNPDFLFNKIKSNNGSINISTQNDPIFGEYINLQVIASSLLSSSIIIDDSISSLLKIEQASGKLIFKSNAPSGINCVLTSQSGVLQWVEYGECQTACSGEA